MRSGERGSRSTRAAGKRGVHGHRLRPRALPVPLDWRRRRALGVVQCALGDNRRVIRRALFLRAPRRVRTTRCCCPRARTRARLEPAPSAGTSPRARRGDATRRLRARSCSHFRRTPSSTPRVASRWRGASRKSTSSRAAWRFSLTCARRMTWRRGSGEGSVESAGDRANHHAHLLITTRRVEGDRLAAKKARDLDPEVRSFKGRRR